MTVIDRASMTPVVYFSTPDDDDASRISILLAAVGFKPERVPEDRPVSLVWRIDQIVRECRLTIRERAVVALIVSADVYATAEIGAALGVSTATAKWHLTNVYAKTGVATKAGLLKRVLARGGS